jgi:hypothetical protein
MRYFQGQPSGNLQSGSNGKNILGVTFSSKWLTKRRDCSLTTLSHLKTDLSSFMKEMGAPVRFSGGRRTYYYTEGGHFHISFMPREQERARVELEEFAEAYS